MFLARKVTLSKWEPKQGLSLGEISADALTSDLRTKSNSLSFWQCGVGKRADVEEAILAMAAARDHVDKFDVVWVDDDELLTDGQTLNNTKGRTPVQGLVDLHVDVCRLDYVRLGRVAHRVVSAIEEERFFRLRKSGVKALLVKAVRQERVMLSDLKKNVQAEVQKSLDAAG
ncbi:MAG: hypothetical protein OXU79_19705 [Gemmatimonadota bacterium]|nr:hypothetical protein [Gemmatimonadota bacterium]